MSTIASLESLRFRKLAIIEGRTILLLNQGEANSALSSQRHVPRADVASAIFAVAALLFRTNFMKSESTSREGCTSPPIPNKRQKLMVSGRHFTASMYGPPRPPPRNRTAAD
jgi:hypothetical protein